MVTIRSYRSSDYPTVKKLLEEAEFYNNLWDSKENLVGIIENNAILVAEENGNVIGSMYIIYFGKKVAYFFRLVVAKEFRNHGVATQMLEYAQKFVKEKGFEEFGMYVNASDVALQEFYKKRGFITSGRAWIYMRKEF